MPCDSVWWRFAASDATTAIVPAHLQHSTWNFQRKYTGGRHFYKPDQLRPGGNVEINAVFMAWISSVRKIATEKISVEICIYT